ncbi:hypothetical protein [Streptosporangium sp. KLBMP 9127]|nr:hypothetical protein [Streptosporangium sp. KLBMP 9127]
MGADGGLDVNHRAIKDARDALEDVLDDLVPGSSENDVTAVAFPVGGAVSQLAADPAALGGQWAAATGFRMSFTNAQMAIEASYAEIAMMLDAAVVRLDQAYKNYGTAEEAGTGPTLEV